MKVKFWGTRGSIPVPGSSTLKYGGNTPCIQITSDNDTIILDAGTGIRELGNFLVKENFDHRIINILISHTHYDHIQGLPFFAPFYDERFEINIYASVIENSKVEHIIDYQMQPFFFPVKRDIFKAKVNFYMIQENSVFDISSVNVQTSMVNHSNDTLSFKLSESGKSLVYMTDNEIKFHQLSIDPEENRIISLNNEIIQFCNKSEYLIHDCMYNQQTFEDKLGWGHSNNIALAYFAMIADVKNLILFHYDPDYSDDMVKEMLIETSGIISGSGKFINCISSFEGLEFDC
ncbi:MAG: MBL fold metallo-hydrolase [Clostridiales bacterium]